MISKGRRIQWSGHITGYDGEKIPRPIGIIEEVSSIYSIYGIPKVRIRWLSQLQSDTYLLSTVEGWIENGQMKFIPKCIPQWSRKLFNRKKKLDASKNR